MDEEVTLFMMPVCICGHIFRDLKLISVPYKGNCILHGQYSEFEPPTCPSCGRWIKGVQTRSFDLGGDGEIIFIERDNLPTVD